MSLPTFLESDGWNVMGLTRSAPGVDTLWLTVDTLLLRRGRGYYLVGVYSRDIMVPAIVIIILALAIIQHSGVEIMG